MPHHVDYKAMARDPDWFSRLDAIIETVRAVGSVDWLGRREIKAAFCCSERDSIRLLHKFGAEERSNALSLSRSALVAQLEVIRGGRTFAAFVRRRERVARQLSSARAEICARQFRVQAALPEEALARLEDLPRTITWRRVSPRGPGRFEIQYDDGADLMWQLAEFLNAAGVNRAKFLANTEPED